MLGKHKRDISLALQVQSIYLSLGIKIADVPRDYYKLPEVTGLYQSCVCRTKAMFAKTYRFIFVLLVLRVGLCGRIYLQLSLDHVHILSPSTAMATLQGLKVEKSGDGASGKRRLEEEGGEGSAPAERKRRRREGEESVAVAPATDGPACRRPCVSVVIRVEYKEGVAWRNTEAGQREGEAGLTLSFSARAAVIGPVVTWEQDPKNRPMTDKEVQPQAEVRKLPRVSNVSQHAPVSRSSLSRSRCCVCFSWVRLLAGPLSSSLASSTDSSLPTPR